MVGSETGLKVLVPGKGGSGKTTVTAAIATHWAQHVGRVLAIDNDLNQNLPATLGMSKAQRESIPPIGSTEQANRIKSHLRGTNQRILDVKHMMKTTPFGPGSRPIFINEDDPIIREFTRRLGSRMHVAAPGEFNAEQLGKSCYHAVNGITELMINHMITKPGELVIFDSTAGADTFASGLFTRFDRTLLVTRPDKKGLGVIEQYVKNLKLFSERHGIDGVTSLAVVINGVSSTDPIMRQKQIDYVKGRLKNIGLDPEITVVGVLRHDPIMDELGVEAATDSKAISTLIQNNKEEFDKIIRAIQETPVDLKRFQKLGELTHIVNAKGGASDSYGTDLTQQIHPDFDYPKAYGETLANLSTGQVLTSSNSPSAGLSAVA